MGTVFGSRLGTHVRAESVPSTLGGVLQPADELLAAWSIFKPIRTLELVREDATINGKTIPSRDFGIAQRQSHQLAASMCWCSGSRGRLDTAQVGAGCCSPTGLATGASRTS